jgi:hypothetical protein
MKYILFFLLFTNVVLSQSKTGKGITEQNGTRSSHLPNASGKETETTQNPAPPAQVFVTCEQPASKHQSYANQTNEEVETNRQIAKFTKYLVYVGLLQAVVLAGQAVLFFLHRKEFKDLAREAGKNAEAALLNSRALINAERPWVMVQVKEIPGENAAKTNFQISAFNYGKGPAHVITCKGPIATWVDDPEKELPVPPDYGDWEWDKRFLAPRDSFPIREPIEPWATKLDFVTERAMQGIPSASKSQLVIYGLIEYGNGVTKTIHKTAFCFRRKREKLSDMGGHLVTCGPPSYNEYT